MSKDILGGDVETQFIYRPDQISFAAAVDAVRADQEAICGYRLIQSKSRSVEQVDAGGRFVEVFVTFSPYPTVSEAQMQSDPSLRPPEPKEPEPMTLPHLPFPASGNLV